MKKWMRAAFAWTAAWLIVAAPAAFARPLSDAETALLRTRSPDAADLAARLGRENNDDALPLLIELRNSALLGNFANGYTGPTTPAIEEYARRHLSDRNIGPQVLQLVRDYRSRALFETLLADIRAAIVATRAGRPGLYPNLLYELEAIARTELPGIEPDLAGLLPDLHPVHSRAITKVLVKRRYLPAEPAVADYLRRAPAGQELAETAWLLSGFETQSSLDALTTRLIELRTTPSLREQQTPADPIAAARMREANEAVVSLVNVLVQSSPANKLDRSRFTPELISEFPPEVRVRVQALLGYREQEERAATELTAANFSRWARAGNRIAQLKDFIARGAPLEGVDAAGDTPLLAAARSRNVEAVRLLLEAGANADARDRQRLAPLHLQARHEGTGVHAPMAVARLLIAARTNVSPRDAEGRTPLHYAVSHRFGDMARLLVEAGADVNAEASDNGIQGLTPLQVALDRQDTEIAAFLRERGARVNPIFSAKRSAMLEAGRLLGPILRGH